MTITDTFLEETAKAIAGESSSMPSHTGVGTTEVTSIGISDTALVGEVGTREAVTTVRTDNTISFTSIRSSTDVVDTVNGDSIESVGVFNMVTQPDGLLAGVPVDGVTHTTSFDLEIIFNLEVDRQ